MSLRIQTHMTLHNAFTTENHKFSADLHLRYRNLNHVMALGRYTNIQQ